MARRDNAVSATEFIEAVFTRTQQAALDALAAGKFQDVSLTVKLRGGRHLEAIMFDGERLQADTPKKN